MPAKKYHIELTAEEQQELKALVSKGRAAAYKQTHARILLLSPNPPMGGVKAGQIGMREPTREKAWAPLGPM